MAFEFTDANFKQTLESTDKKVVLVDLWAEWCGPCRMVGPLVEELAEEMKEEALIGKLDVDNNPEVPTEFGVRSIPTLLIFKNGQLVDKQIGAVSKETIKGKIVAQLA